VFLMQSGVMSFKKTSTNSVITVVISGGIRILSFQKTSVDSVIIEVTSGDSTSGWVSHIGGDLS